MRNQIFHSPGNEEAELAKIPGDGDPPPPHWDLYFRWGILFNLMDLV
jgi:hypothetical protein